MAAKVVAIQSTTAGLSPLPGKFSNRQLSIATLLHLATLGGAQVCSLDHQIGSFAPKKSFDALLVDVDHATGNPAMWSTVATIGRRNLDGMLERFLFCGDDRNIASVFVQGKLIGGCLYQGQ